MGGLNGSRVELMACESPRKNYPDLPACIFDSSHNSPIYIEGEEEYVVRMLEDWLRAIRSCKKHKDAIVAALEKQDAHDTEKNK